MTPCAQSTIDPTTWRSRITRVGYGSDAAKTSPKPARAAFAQFLAWLRVTPPTEVAQHYVETFDLRRRCALYLTYYRHGDTRRRGMAMIIFKTAYRDAGFVPCDDELPDYLPMVLEYAALADPERFAHAQEIVTHAAPGLQHVYGSGALRSPSAELVSATHTDHDVLVVRAHLTVLPHDGGADGTASRR